MTSELAKSHSKGASQKILKASLVSVLSILSLMGSYPAQAALDGVTTFVEADNQNVKMGNGIVLGNNLKTSGAVAIGDHAHVDDYVNQEGSIAIGKNAFAENLFGAQEKAFKFGQEDTAKWVSSIAIGQNTYARSGSTMIGDHKYIGKLGDVVVDGSDVNKVRSKNINVNATTIGANSYNQGAFSSVTGAYSIISGKYDGGSWSSSATQNLGANIYGSLNSIESNSSDSQYAGLANSIVGTANRTANSNGTLIFGAGNEVENSIEELSGLVGWFGLSGGPSAKDFGDKLRTSVKNSKSGGAVLVIGGGNKATYAVRSQLIGVNNKLSGQDGNISQYNLINGYNNTGTNVSGVTVIGINRTVSNAKHTVVIGSASSVTTTTANNAVVLGLEANATQDDGVALGSHSVAAIDRGIAGYDPATKTASTDETGTWKATHAAVSVGSGNTITRQITGVAAGTADTDAVNVAQLKKVQDLVGSGNAEAGKHSTVVAGDYVTVTEAANDAGGKQYTIKGPEIVSTDSTVTITDKVENGKKVGYDLSAKDTYTTAGTYDADKKTIHFTQNDATKNYDVDVTGLVDSVTGAVNKGMKFSGDSGAVITKKLGEELQIKGGATEVTDNNIGVVSQEDGLYVKLAKDVTGLNSINAKTITGDTINTKNLAVGDITITADGIAIKDGPSVTKTGMDAGGKKITNVAVGTISESSTDAVNGSQLYATNQIVEQSTNRINAMSSRMNQVGAGAAALAALHPLDFDPDDKWDFSAGYGNYAGANAVAVGAYYRPNEDTMFSVGGSFGDGENMVNAGVSWKLGQKNSVSRSRVSLAKDMLAMKEQIAVLTKELAAYKAGQISNNNERTMENVEFPDVPENHWAYSYVKYLADRGYLKGYPDGEFKGNHAMTRYEYAAVIYRALQNGAPSDGNMARSVDEFGSELAKVQSIDRFRVDRISGEDNDRNKIERVRINDQDDEANNEFRDVYGSHIRK